MAHAGGGINGLTYTNSIDALDANVGRYELFELDFSFTSDGKLVCIHDWAGAAKANFGREFDKPPTFAEFTALNSSKQQPKNCTLETLIGWLERHPGKRIITDVKDDNVKALTYLATHYRHAAERFIPQIYQPEQYEPVQALGYKSIIFTMYRYFGTYDRLVDFAAANPLFAITMPPPHVPHLTKRMRDLGVPTYVHTINSAEQLEALRANGVAEIYTDWLHPERQ